MQRATANITLIYWLILTHTYTIREWNSVRVCPFEWLNTEINWYLQLTSSVLCVQTKKGMFSFMMLRVVVHKCLFAQFCCCCCCCCLVLSLNGCCSACYICCITEFAFDLCMHCCIQLTVLEYPAFHSTCFCSSRKFTSLFPFRRRKQNKPKLIGNLPNGSHKGKLVW